MLLSLNNLEMSRDHETEVEPSIPLDVLCDTFECDDLMLQVQDGLRVVQHNSDVFDDAQRALYLCQQGPLTQGTFALLNQNGAMEQLLNRTLAWSEDTAVELTNVCMEALGSFIVTVLVKIVETIRWIVQTVLRIITFGLYNPDSSAKRLDRVHEAYTQCDTYIKQPRSHNYASSSRSTNAGASQGSSARTSSASNPLMIRKIESIEAAIQIVDSSELPTIFEKFIARILAYKAGLVECVNRSRDMINNPNTPPGEALAFRTHAELELAELERSDYALETILAHFLDRMRHANAIIFDTDRYAETQHDRYVERTRQQAKRVETILRANVMPTGVNSPKGLELQVKDVESRLVSVINMLQNSKASPEVTRTLSILMHKYVKKMSYLVGSYSTLVVTANTVLNNTSEAVRYNSRVLTK